MLAIIAAVLFGVAALVYAIISHLAGVNAWVMFLALLGAGLLALHLSGPVTLFRRQ